MKRWIVIAGLLGLVGCGLQPRVAMGPEPRSIGVEIFANDSREPDLERTLHKEISRAVQQYIEGDLRRPSQADLVIRGRILEWRTRGGVRDRENILREQGVTILLQGELVDRLSGEVMAGPLKESIDVGFLLEGVEARRTGSARALANLADALVLDLAAHANRNASKPAPDALDPHAGHAHDHGVPPEASPGAN